MRPPVLRQSGRGDIARGTIISGETQLVNPSPEQRAERRTNVINYGRKGGGKTRTEPSQSRGLPTVTPVDRRQAWPGGGQSQPPGFMGFSRRTTTRKFRHAPDPLSLLELLVSFRLSVIFLCDSHRPGIEPVFGLQPSEFRKIIIKK